MHVSRYFTENWSESNEAVTTYTTALFRDRHLVGCKSTASSIVDGPITSPPNTSYIVCD